MVSGLSALWTVLKIDRATPGTQLLSAAEAVPLARDANDQLTAAIAAHHDRFAGFATLPTSEPEAAVAELERAVHQLGFKDYPYVIDEHSRTFLENAPISPADKEKIAHGNAEKVLKI